MTQGERRGHGEDSSPSDDNHRPPPSIEETRVKLIRWLDDGAGALERLCTDLLRREALFLDSDLFVEKAISRVALSFHTLPEEGLNREWLDERLEHLTAEMLTDDYERLKADAIDRRPGNEDRSFFVQAFGIDPEDASARAIKFNALPKVTRRAFFAIAIENIEFDDLVGTEFPTAPELREHTIRAIEVILDKDRNFKGDEE